MVLAVVVSLVVVWCWLVSFFGLVLAWYFAWHSYGAYSLVCLGSIWSLCIVWNCIVVFLLRLGIGVCFVFSLGSRDGVCLHF